MISSARSSPSPGGGWPASSQQDVLHGILVGQWAKDDHVSAPQLLDALLQVCPVEESLVLQAVPDMLKQIPVQAVGADFPQDVADGMNAGHVEE